MVVRNYRRVEEEHVDCLWDHEDFLRRDSCEGAAIHPSIHPSADVIVESCKHLSLSIAQLAIERRGLAFRCTLVDGLSESAIIVQSSYSPAATSRSVIPSTCDSHSHSHSHQRNQHQHVSQQRCKHTAGSLAHSHERTLNLNTRQQTKTKTAPCHRETEQLEHMQVRWTGGHFDVLCKQHLWLRACVRVRVTIQLKPAVKDSVRSGRGEGGKCKLEWGRIEILDKAPTY